MSGTFERLILRREENFERRAFFEAWILALARRTSDLPMDLLTALMRPAEYRLTYLRRYIAMRKRK